jgi:transcriptional regulator GlxA family with amidase domain
LAEGDVLLALTDMPRKIGFLLIDDFALMSYASVIEPFRAANSLAQRDLYRWRLFSPDGDPARASNGASLIVDGAARGNPGLDLLLVCAGGNPAAIRDPGMLAWLRELEVRGTTIGGVSGGPYLLARAGLLDGYCCTIHWEHLPAFVEEFPQLSVSRSLFVIDRNRLTCAGGIAGLDLAIEVIERDHGPALAAAVGEWYIRTERRTGAGPQRMSLQERFGVRNAKLLQTLGEIEANLVDPLPRAWLAERAGVSVRQLERLFATHLGATIGQVYLRARLDRAASLLRQSAMPLLDVALACGFSSASAFSRAFRRQFGCAPSKWRPASG